MISFLYDTRTSSSLMCKRRGKHDRLRGDDVGDEDTLQDGEKDGRKMQKGLTVHGSLRQADDQSQRKTGEHDSLCLTPCFFLAKFVCLLLSVEGTKYKLLLSDKNDPFIHFAK